MYIVRNCCLPIANLETNLLKPVFYLQKMTNFVKTRTFYKKLPLFIKNSILHIYKKLKPLIWAFIKNSIFGNNRDPCGQHSRFAFQDYRQMFRSEARRTCSGSIIKGSGCLNHLWAAENPGGISLAGIGGKEAGGCFSCISLIVAALYSAMPDDTRACCAFLYWPSCASLVQHWTFFSSWLKSTTWPPHFILFFLVWG